MQIYCQLKDHKAIIENQVVAQAKGYTLVEVEPAYDGSLWEKGFAPEKPLPTHEEIREMRANAYQCEVDPITAHIQRLRDCEEIPVTEIAELIAERNAKVAEIKERLPYPDEIQPQE